MQKPSLFKNLTCLQRLIGIVLLFTLALPATLLADDRIEDYRLGAGDIIRISVLHEENLSMDVRLSHSGTLSYPLLGTLNAKDLTPRELEVLIRDGLAARYLVEPLVSVNIVEFRKYFVGGEVRSPGGFPYSPGLTIEQAIVLAGGLTEKASDQITLTREGETTPASTNVDHLSQIAPGDHLTVLPAGEIVIQGAVRAPGVYPYTRGMTIHKALALAGGANERASSTIIVIHEADPEHKGEEVGPFTPVKPGDLIHIDESFF